jgi:hypothetical protein
MSTVKKTAQDLEIERLRAENEALRAVKHKALSFKVSAKGALSVYGFGKWPVTLYKQQWLRLVDAKTLAMLEQFIKANDKLLTEKPIA